MTCVNTILDETEKSIYSIYEFYKNTYNKPIIYKYDNCIMFLYKLLFNCLDRPNLLIFN